uniref:AMP-dependent synthetase/ligase domain-containing protein n=1 Tax=Photinus pyralis TaxID=7054 RepID=A0A1Y1L4Z5_PHOPY
MSTSFMGQPKEIFDWVGYLVLEHHQERSFVVNIDNKVGSVGCIPNRLKGLMGIFLIKYDPNTGEPTRDTNGRCIRCGSNEPGLIIGEIRSKVPLDGFSRYLDVDASEKKILSDVFVIGDKYYNSGDVLSCDGLGYFYFQDRVGDTFRWKGENVSTAEVEDIICKTTKLNQVNVYGVEVIDKFIIVGFSLVCANVIGVL